MLLEWSNASPTDIREAVFVTNSLGHFRWQFIEKADPQDLPEILNAIANRYTHLHNHGASQQLETEDSEKELCST
jgi:hypothetical protein